MASIPENAGVEQTDERGRQRNLLLVDDEESILSALRRLLRRDGYHILTANSGEEALQILADNPVDVVMSDQRMPGMSGVDLLRQVKVVYPDVVRIVLSGYTELQSITDAINEGAIYKFLTKPWDDEQLRLNIREAFSRKELADENARLNRALSSVNQELQTLLEAEQRRLRHDEVVLRVVQEILQAVPLPIIGIDEGGLIVCANERASTVFGHDQGLIGCLARDVLPPDLLEGVDKGHADSVWAADGVNWQTSYRSLGAGGGGCLIVLSRNEH
jgi:CheY-like chemotaxis protein